MGIRARDASEGCPEDCYLHHTQTGDHLPGCPVGALEKRLSDLVRNGPEMPFQLESSVWPGLGKLQEELGELGQVCGKLIATGGQPNHWDGTNLRERMVEELGDVLAAIDFLIQENGIGTQEVYTRKRSKMALYREWREKNRGAAETR